MRYLETTRRRSCGLDLIDYTDDPAWETVSQTRVDACSLAITSDQQKAVCTVKESQLRTWSHASVAHAMHAVLQFKHIKFVPRMYLMSEGAGVQLSAT